MNIIRFELKRITSILLLCFSPTVGNALSNLDAPAPRLAIINTKAAGNVADLLTVELSQLPGVELVERDEVRRVFDEKAISLQSGGTKDWMSAGGILGGDGLIILSHEAHKLHLRLIATRTGVVLLDLMTDPSMDTLPAWILHAVKKIEPLLGKLLLSPDEGVLLSFQGLYDVSPMADSLNLERSLSLGVMHRLSQQRHILCLERSKMQKMVWETKWTPTNDEAFLTPHAVVSGTFDISDGVIAVELKIDRKGENPPQMISIRSSVENQGDIVQKISQSVIDAVSEAGTLTTWDVQEEAASLFELAKWANQNNLIEEGIAACESAAALGMRTPELWRLRIFLYASLVYPTQYPPRLRPNILAFRSGYPFQNLDVRSDERPLFAAERCLDLLQQYHQIYPPSADLEKIHWSSYVAGHAVWLISELIRVYVDDGMEVQYQQRLGDLRAGIRRLMDPWIGTIIVRYYDPYISAMAIQYAQFWYDDPNEVIECKRKLIATGLKYPPHRDRARSYLQKEPVIVMAGYPKLHDRAPKHQDPPPLIAWRGESEEALMELWASFYNELCASQEPSERMWGRTFAEQAGKKIIGLDTSKIDFASVWKSREEWVRHQPRVSFNSPLPSLKDLEDYERVKSLTVTDRYMLATNLLDRSSGSFIDAPLLAALLQPDELSESQARQAIALLVAYCKKNLEQTHHPSLDHHLFLISQIISKILHQKKLIDLLHWPDAEPISAGVVARAVPFKFPPPGDYTYSNAYACDGKWAVGGRGHSLCLVDLENNEIRMLRVPQSHQREDSTPVRSPSRGRLLVGEGYMFYLWDGVLYTYQIAEQEWSQIGDLPKQCQLVWQAPYLYLAFSTVGRVGTRYVNNTPVEMVGNVGREKRSSGLFRYDVKTGELKTVFNSRRRPEIHPMDLLKPMDWSFAGANDHGELFLGTRMSLYRFFPEGSSNVNPLFHESRAFKFSPASSGVIAYTMSNIAFWNGLVHRIFLVSTNGETNKLLIANQEYHPYGIPYDPPSGYDIRKLPDAWAHPMWTLPPALTRKLPGENLLITPAMMGENLTLYDVRRANEFTVELRHSIYLFRPGEKTPDLIPVRIPSNAEKGTSLLNQTEVRKIWPGFPDPRNVTVMPIRDKGWLLIAHGSGRWFVPMQDVLSWSEKNDQKGSANMKVGYLQK